jgi:hypothetical protein
MPEVLRLIAWLEGRAADMDARASTCITHGDYRQAGGLPAATRGAVPCSPPTWVCVMVTWPAWC